MFSLAGLVEFQVPECDSPEASHITREDAVVWYVGGVCSP